MSDKNISIIEALKRSVESIKQWTNEKLNNKADAPKLTNITIPASGWQDSANLYSQVVVCNGVNINSKIDLHPTPEQIVELQDEEISLMAVNNNGIVTIYAIGNKPTSDMIIQALIMDVDII